MKVTVFVCSPTVHAVAGWTASRACSRAWRGGESYVVDVALSCWYLYSDAVMSLRAEWSTYALKNPWHSVGLRPVKVELVMLQVSRDSLGASDLW